MLLSFSCGNYASFKEVKTLSMVAAKPVKEYQEDNVIQAERYNLLKSAVIYGANASGKSNLLKAMAKMKNLVINSSKDLQKDEPLGIEPFRLNLQCAKQPSFFEVCIDIDDIRYRYGFEADQNSVKSEWLFFSTKIKETPLFIRDNDEIEVFDKFVGGVGLEERTRSNALFLSVCAQFNVDIAGDILDWFVSLNVISGSQDHKYQSFSENMFMEGDLEKKWILDFLTKADLSIRDVAVKKDESKVELKPFSEWGKAHAMVSKTTISSSHNVYSDAGEVVDSTLFDFNNQESEGSKKYFRLSGPIIDTLMHGRVLVIDELDSRLHPVLTSEIVRLFNSRHTNLNNAQLVFVTHNTNLLSSNLFRRDQVWFTEKDHVEATDLYSLVEYKTEKGLVRKDASLEKDYFRGRYGAIPLLGDFNQIWGD